MPIRPFKMPADLDVLAAVIPAAFQYPENDEWSLRTDELADLAASMRSTKRLWPLLQMLQVFWSPLRDALRGFIWEEDGQPVGTINVARMGGAQTWLIGNVGVLPAYRRRGIARQLVQASVELARTRGGQQVFLDVLAGNVPARQLYESVGFTHYSGNIEFERPADAPLPDAPPFPDGYTLAPRAGSDWRARYALKQRTVPPSVQRYEPVTEARYRIPGFVRPFAWLADQLGGARTRRWLVRQGADGPVVALGSSSVGKSASSFNHLTLEVDPDHAAIAAPLLAALLAEIDQQAPGRRIDMTAQEWETPVIAAAEAWGFTRRFTMHRLGLILNA